MPGRHPPDSERPRRIGALRAEKATMSRTSGHKVDMSGRLRRGRRSTTISSLLMSGRARAVPDQQRASSPRSGRIDRCEAAVRYPATSSRHRLVKHCVDEDRGPERLLGMIRPGVGRVPLRKTRMGFPRGRRLRATCCPLDPPATQRAARPFRLARRDRAGAVVARPVTFAGSASHIAETGATPATDCCATRSMRTRGKTLERESLPRVRPSTIP